MLMALSLLLVLDVILVPVEATYGSHTSLELDSSALTPYSLVSDGSYLYVSLDASKIVKIDLETFSEVASLTVGNHGYAVQPLIISGGFLYAGTDYAPAEIVKVNPATFTVVSTLTLAGGEDHATAFAVSGNYLYVGLDTNPAKIAKIDLSSFSELTAPLSTDYGGMCSMVVSDGFLYLSSDNPAKVTKVDLASFSKVGSVNTGGSHYFGAAMTCSNGVLYVSIVNSPNKIVRVNLNNFTVGSNLTLSKDFSDSLNVYGDFLYTPTWEGYLVLVNLTTFSEVNSTLISTDTVQGNFVPSTISNGYLYVGLDLSSDPAKIVKVDLNLPPPEEPPSPPGGQNPPGDNGGPPAPLPPPPVWIPPTSPPSEPPTGGFTWPGLPAGVPEALGEIARRLGEVAAGVAEVARRLLGNPLVLLVLIGIVLGVGYYALRNKGHRKGRKKR